MKFKKSVFEYDNYRVFLKDVYEHARKLDKKYSYRYFAKIAGFQTSNFMMLVIKGQRNLTKDSAEKFAKGLKLSKEEKEFFKNLVFFNQASNHEEKSHYAEQLLKSHTY